MANPTAPTNKEFATTLIADEDDDDVLDAGDPATEEGVVVVPGFVEVVEVFVVALIRSQDKEI